MTIIITPQDPLGRRMESNNSGDLVEFHLSKDILAMRQDTINKVISVCFKHSAYVHTGVVFILMSNRCAAFSSTVIEQHLCSAPSCKVCVCCLYRSKCEIISYSLLIGSLLLGYSSLPRFPPLHSSCRPLFMHNSFSKHFWFDIFSLSYKTPLFFFLLFSPQHR